jgi:iron complex outermembrane recepter protein
MRRFKFEGFDSTDDRGAVRRHVRNVVREVARNRGSRLVTRAAGSGVLALAMLTGPVMAQDTASPDTSQQAEAQNQAADTGESLDTLQEVVVTAQFRAEKLQETPLAITAISGDALRERGVDNLSQVADAAPNVSLDLTGSAFGPNMSAFIRGVGQGDQNFAFEPGVGIYVDDIYHATLAGSLFELFDLERVEVLRGPQGTLFGKNSIGGAIRMISTKPKGDGAAYIEGTYGAFNRKDFRGMFDISLVPDQLFLRVSAMSQEREGYVRRLDYACANPDLGASQGYVVNTAAPELLQSQALGSGNCEIGKEGGKNLQGARAALRWIQSDTLEVNFSADFLDDNSEAAATKLIVADTTLAPGAPLVDLQNAGFLQRYGVIFDQRFITNDKYTNYSTFFDLDRGRAQPAVARTESWGGALTVDWDISDAVHLKSVTGYRGYRGDWSDDQDATPLPSAYVYNIVDHRQFSQEFQFTGTVGKLDWATGLFYFDGYSLARGHVNVGMFFLDFDQDDPSNVEDIAGFVQGTYHLTDKLGLTAGVRYTDEQKDYQYNHQFFATTKTDASYTRTDWKVGVDYQLTDDILTYAQVSTGFKGGGFNPRPFTGAQVTGFGPETLRSHEIGMKSEWLDHKLRVNVALFQADYKDLQFNSQTTDATGVPYVGTTNVGEVDIRGFEVEVDARLFEGLLINGAVGYTDQEYKDLGNAIGCSAPGIVPIPLPGGAPGLFSNCVTNNPILSDEPGGPKWRGNAGVQYTIPFAGGSTITPRLDVNFQDGAPTGNSNDRYTFDDLAGYTLYNGRVTWSSSDDNWAVSLLGTNLTDKFYYVNYFNLVAFGEAMAAAQPGRPREWALQVRRSF